MKSFTRIAAGAVIFSMVFGTAAQGREIYSGGIYTGISGPEFLSMIFGTDSQASNVKTNASDWAKENVIAAYESGIVGQELLNKCQANITRGEFAQISMGLYRLFTGNGGASIDDALFEDDLSNDSNMAYKLGIMDRISETVFAPDALVMREEYAQYIVSLLQASGVKIDLSQAGATDFIDKSGISSEYISAVEFLEDSGILSGYDGYYYPTSYVTVEQALYTFAKVYEYFSLKDFYIGEQKTFLGDTEASVLAKLGQPQRTDMNEYGFKRLVYKDGRGLLMVGINNGAVQEIFTNRKDFKYNGIESGTDITRFKNSIFDKIIYKVAESDYASEASIYFDNQNGFAIEGIYVKNRSLRPNYSAAVKEVESSAERELFDLINTTRVNHGLGEYEWSEPAAGAAKSHGREMSETGSVVYTGLDGSTPFDRLWNAGVKFKTAAENVYGGNVGSIETFYSWMGFPGLRGNILSLANTKVGTGCGVGRGMLYSAADFYSE